MIKDIIKYPQPLSVEYATDVRAFDKELFALIDDLKDTMKENNLDGLSAYQIGSYYNVVVIKDKDENYIELINPRLINHSGTIITKEKTAYYGDREATIKRYENISVIYQDKDANNRSLQASGELAVVLQRKIDYTFGATFIHKMDQKEKIRFENFLDTGVDIGIDDYCPTIFKRDKIIKFINIIMGLMVVNLISSFFIDDIKLKTTLWDVQFYSFLGVIGLNIVYFFYAQYEGKKYTSCMSCQLGNIVGTCVLSFIKLFLIIFISYFILNPS